MKKNIFLFLVPLLLFTLILLPSCNKNKSYIYSLVWQNDVTKATFEDSPIIIEAPNDSIAFVTAYTNFLTKQKNYYLFKKEADKQMLNHWEYEPLRFTLIDDKKNDISSGAFLVNRESLLRLIDLKTGKTSSMREASNVLE